jgi:hypothetical protein
MRNFYFIFVSSSCQYLPFESASQQRALSKCSPFDDQQSAGRCFLRDAVILLLQPRRLGIQTFLITHFNTTFHPFVTGFDKSACDHVGGESASPTVSLFSRSLSAQSRVSLIDFVPCGRKSDVQNSTKRVFVYSK